MSVKITRRSRWGPVGRPVRDQTPKRAIVIHHSAGFDSRPESGAAQSAVMRAVDSFHYKGNGWSGGIGYCLVVFQPRGRLRRARVFEGRGENMVPAAQADHNSGTIPICVIDSTGGELLKPATLRLLGRLCRDLRKRHPSVSHVKGHREVPGQGTSCPGNYIAGDLGKIAQRAGGLKRNGWPL